MKVVNKDNSSMLASTAFNVDRLEEEVATATGHKVSNYFKFKEGDLAEFLRNRPSMFLV